ncbi:major facilitator superfamily permease [Kocuria dechangensis]|uniref:Major facilitator superfamily permease n=1 Tax=Kocuria dechangensis TaxID=1176249 RepID=A0A917H747_9MICC|nr:MFS transporter [Kocuria dechangensis]GGG69746.1 major facilitator superfamily permease [Kocuria dechangensis]
MDIRHQIDASKMSSYQWLIIGVATFLNALDGYDVLAMAFTATSVTQEFGLSGAQLGWLLSAGLIGMAVGSLVLGPFADRYGRRNILVLALAVNALGLFLSTTAGSAFELGLWRVVTGLGVGGILASATVLTSEYANARRRGMAVSIFTAGYGVGATLGGMGATQLIPAFGWRSVFLTGGLLTLVAIALVLAVLPESVDYLRTRRPENAVAKLNRIARRIGLDGDVELGPAPVSTGKEQSSVGQLLNSRYRTASILLWISFFVIMFGFYFANSWTPRLLVESGMTEQQGIIGGLMLTMGGTFGSLLYGVLTTRWDARLTLIVFTLLSAVTLVLFITTTSIPALAFSSGVVVGMLINGCIAGLYTVAPMTYEPGIRTTGVGWGIGVGRAGAILAPIVVGALLDSGWSPTQLYIGVAVVVALAALALLRLRPYEEPAVRDGAPRRTEPSASS